LFGSHVGSTSVVDGHTEPPPRIDRIVCFPNVATDGRSGQSELQTQLDVMDELLEGTAASASKKHRDVDRASTFLMISGSLGSPVLIMSAPGSPAIRQACT
jgi:hypothetical protein